MNDPSSVRLLGKTDNERGDLFTRLARDLFFSLGYDNLKLDLASAGREVDIHGTHRFEPRRLVAECKAHSRPMGGGELNKFLGVLTRERQKHRPQPIAGYFVSLGGFTGTGLEQEEQSGDEAIILFDAARIIAELQKSRVVVPLTDACAVAGTCAAAYQRNGIQLDQAELIGHLSGYIWVIYFSHNKHRSHFVFVHADGTPLAASVAEAIIESDSQVGGHLRALEYIRPPAAANQTEVLNETLEQYTSWLGEECGYIQLDGLPADADLSATKLKLEKLFVPLKAMYRPTPLRVTDALETTIVEIGTPAHDPGDSEVGLGEAELDLDDRGEANANDIESLTADLEDVTEPIGTLLDRETHLAILASPGGGKSTLIKRLATAYSFPSRRLEVADALPDRDWFPLYLRCRDLRDRSNRPVLELLHGIAAFANMDEEHAKCFHGAVSNALRTGRALLLIDGLDEISEEGFRRRFDQNLRTFVAMFPTTALVITSRVAGFRDVAGVVAGTCKQVTLAPLDQDDVSRLCVSWHVEVIADTEKVRSEAIELAKFIWKNEYIRKLAENPLLLTTLLVVKRSNGEIPPTRAELYSEAVRVLVRTWNVEGYAPLDERETIARLSYVACAMMQRAIHVIEHSALIKLLHLAAKEMEPELQFAKVSPTEFIERIEYRSSLLMQTGYGTLDGNLEPVFEFRHLTFQEYLAARGFVYEQYPGRNQEVALVELLAPHITDERWREVIPLAAVLAGRKADPVIKRLVATCRNNIGNEAENAVDIGPISVLGQCLRDEVTITPGTLRDALAVVGRAHLARGGLTVALLNGKFGNTFRDLIEEEYFSDGTQRSQFQMALLESFWVESRISQNTTINEDFTKELAMELVSGDRRQKVRAALLLMRVAFQSQGQSSKITQILGPISEQCRDGFSKMVLSGDVPSAQAAAWALVWFGVAEVWTDPMPLETIKQLFEYWRNATEPGLARNAGWALGCQQRFARDSIPNEIWGSCDDWLRSRWDNSFGPDRGAVIVVGWYRRSPWTDKELATMIFNEFRRSNYLLNGRQLLSKLGAAAVPLLSKWDRDQVVS